MTLLPGPIVHVQPLGLSDVQLVPVRDQHYLPSQSPVTGDAFWLCVVALLWGATNPLIRKGSKGVEDIKRSNAIYQFLAELRFLVFNWKVR